MGARLLKLCGQLRAHKRPVMILGGNAELWSMPPGWDIMVKQMILICRSQGVLAIGGVHYLTQMEKCGDGWHLYKTEANYEALSTMLLDAVDAAFAVIPYGSYVQFQPVPQEAMTAPSAQAGALMDVDSEGAASAQAGPTVGDEGAASAQAGPTVDTSAKAMVARIESAEACSAQAGTLETIAPHPLHLAARARPAWQDAQHSDVISFGDDYWPGPAAAREKAYDRHRTRAPRASSEA